MPLRTLGIAVIFEKENINTLESDSEMLITLLGAFAQAESESISANVRWGKRQAMREGKGEHQYKKAVRPAPWGKRRAGGHSGAGEGGTPDLPPVSEWRQLAHD